MRELKALVVGVGNMGQNHVRVLQRLSDVTVVAVVDRDRAAARVVADRFGVPHVYTTLAKCLAEQEIDVASIAVPPTAAPEVARMLIDAGVHFLLEKPGATSVADLQRIATRATTQGITVGVGYTERFNPAVRMARQALKEGVIGKVRFIRTQRIGVPTSTMGDVNAILDIGVHDISVIGSFARGLPSRIRAAGQQVFGAAIDVASVSLEYPELLAQIEVNKIAPFKKRTLELFGTKGLLQVDYMLQTLTFFPLQHMVEADNFDQLLAKYGMSPQSVGINVAFQEPLQLELEDFLSAVRKRRKPEVTLEEAIGILTIARKAMQNL